LRVRNRILPVSGGDGSTLSLDFTSGVLDPRFTFSRSSTATLINSQGYLQFANANLMTYSNPRQTGTAWLASGTVTWGSSTLTDPTGGSAAQSITFGTTGSAIFNTSGTTVVSGITHTFSVWMRSATGTTNVRIGDANVGVVATVTLTTTWQRFSCQYTTSGTNDGGAIYSQTGTPSAEFYVWGAQVQPGSIVGELIQTSGTINTNAPRFDYDPTTLAPRGLLLEGSATNLTTRSDDFNTTVNDGTQWSTSGYTSGTLSTTLPDGTTGNARRISIASGSGSFRSQTITVTANTAYTWSFWARNNGGSQARYRVWNVTAGSSIVDYTLSGNNYVSSIGGANNTSSTWVRVSVPFTTPAGCTGVYVYPCSSDSGTVDLLVWGAQLEAGSGGASSYIPTGTSQVQRATDTMTMADISALNFNQSGGTVLMQVEGNPRDQGVFPHFAGFEQSPSGRGWNFLRLNNTSAGVLRMLGTAWNSAGGTLINSANHTRPAGRFKFAATLEPSVSRMTYVISGGSALVDTSTAGTLATIGSLRFNNTTDTAATDFGSVWVSQFKYWPTVLPNATLQSLTA
jgi:hypothetical protein